jgi:hypothetical protein
MNMNDELERLSKLRKDGTLNEEEFAQAKGRILRQENEPTQRDNIEPPIASFPSKF